MRYGGLMKLGKKAFCVNFTLLDKLKITTKEAILLQQIEYVNNKSDYLVLPLVVLSKITNMSRGHLYRCLSKLKKIGLIVVTDEGIAITDYYKEIKQQDFLENHNKNKALKLAKTAKNVACDREVQNVRLEAINASNDNELLNNDTLTNDNITTNTMDSNAHNDNSHCGIACNDKENNNKKVLHSNNNKINTITHSYAKDKIDKTLENKGNASTQKQEAFFVTKVSQNETNLSQNETLLLYNNKYNNISLCDKSHKEYIYSLPKEAANKKQGLRDSLALLLARLKNNLENRETLSISDEMFKELVGEFQNRVQAQAKVKPNAFFTKLSADMQEQVRSFMYALNEASLIFLNTEAKKEFLQDVETLANNGRLLNAIKYSSENKCLWLCENNDDSKGRKFLETLYGYMQKELDKKIKKLQAEYVKNMPKEAILHELVSQYGVKIDEFIAYREQRGRYLNKQALSALCDTLASYFAKGQDVEAILNQSIYRGYNWVFPLTHKKRIRNVA